MSRKSPTQPDADAETLRESHTEELVTANSELKRKSEELARLNNDLLNLISSTHTGIIFLDPRLRVKRFTPRATELFHLIESDLGRPFAHISHRIRNGRPVEQAAHVLERSEQIEEVIHSEEERWYRLRMFPYRTLDNLVDGVVITFDLHERKEAEARLRESEARFRLLAESAPVLIWVADAEGNGEFANQAYLEFGGFTPDSFAGTGWQLILHPEDSAAYVASWLAAVEQRMPFRGVTRTYRADGALRWVEAYALPRLTGDGEFLGYVGSTIDITERKEAQERLHQANSRFERAERAANGFVFEIDLSSGYVMRSPNFTHVTGYQPEEIAPSDAWVQLVHPDDRAVLEQRQVLIHNAPSYQLEYRLRHQQGYYLWVQEQGLIERDTKGQPRTIVGTTLDISARKAAQEALRASEAQLKTILDNVPAAVYMLSTDHRYLYVNHLFAASYHQTPGQIHGLSVFDRFAPEIANALAENERQVMEQCLAMSFEEMAPLDGEMHYYATVKAPLLDEAGNPYALLGISLDVTSQKRAEEALRQSEERLRLATTAGRVGIFDHDLLANRTEFSEIYARIAGVAVNAPFQREDWLARVHPDDRHVVTEAWERAQKSDAFYRYECRILRPDQSLAWVEVDAQVGRDESGRAVRITGAVREITEQKQSALHQQFLLDLSTTLRDLNDPKAIQQTVVEQLGQYLGVSYCRFNAIDLADDRATLLASWRQPGLPPPTDVIPLSAYTSPAYLSHAQAGRTLVVHHAYQDQQAETARDLLIQHGRPATIRVPCLRNGEWVASLHVLQTTPRRWRADEVQLLERVAQHFWPLVEKARAEQALRQQEEFVRQIADNVPGLVAYLGTDEHYRFVNATFESWFRQPRHTLIGGTVRQLLGTDERERLGLYRQRAFAGETVTYEDRFTYPDGITRDIWGRYQPDVAADGRVLGFYIFVMDISERKQAELKIQQSNAILSAMVESSNDAIFVRDLTGRYLLANRTGAEQVQIPQAQIIGRQYEELFSPAEIEGIRNDDRPILEQGQSVSIEHTTDHHGVTRYWHTLKMPLCDSEGKIIGLISSARDISDRKRIELHQQFLSNLFLDLRLRSDIDAMMSELVASLGQHIGTDSCRLNEVDLKGERFTIRQNWGGNGVAPGSFYPLSELAPSEIVAALQAGETVQVDSTATDPRTAQVVDAYSREEVSSFIGVPIFQDGMWRFTLSVKCQGERRWQPEEVALLETVASQFSALLEKVRAEEALRRSERRYRTIFENAGVSLWEEDFSQVKQAVDVLTSDWRVAGLTDMAATMQQYCADHPDFVQTMLQKVRILDVNQETARLYGLSKDKLLRPFAQFFTPETLERFVNQLVMIASGRERYTFDGPIQTPQGETHHVAFAVVFPQEAGGLLDRVLVSGQDVTALKAAEAQLRASEERFRQTFAQAPVGVGQASLDGRIELVNPAFCRILGYREAELIGRKISDFVLPEDRTIEIASLKEVQQRNQTISSIEKRYRRKDGSIVWAQRTGSVVRDQSGSPLFGVAIIEDISDRKATADALRASEERLRMAMEAGNMAAFEYLPASNSVRRSGSAKTLQGLGEVGISGEYYGYVHPDDRQQLRQRIEGITPDQPSYEYEYRFLRPDNGHLLWLLDRGQGIFDPQGQLQRLTGMVMDISDRKRREAEGRFLADLGEVMVKIQNPEELLWEVAQQVGHFLGVSRSFFMENDPAQEAVIVHPSYQQAGQPGVAKVFPLADFDRQNLADYQAGRTVVIADTQTHPRTASRYPQRYAPINVKSLVTVPLLRNGQWMATLSVTHHEARLWSAEDVHLLQTVAERAWLALENRRLFEEVQASQRFLQSIADTTPNLLYLFDLRTMSNRYANRQLTTMLGYTPDELQASGGEVIPSLMHPDDLADLPNHQQHLRQLVDGEIAEWEYRMRHKDDSWHWLGGRETVFERDDEGRAIVILGAVQDITIRKEADLRLRASEQRLRQLADSMPQMVWRNDGAGQFEYFNQQWLSYTGLSLEQSLQHANQMIHPDDREKAVKAWQQALAAGNIYDCEMRIRRHDGSYRWFLVRTVPVRNEAGTIINWYGSSTDISELKQAEQAVRQSETRYRALVQSSSQVMWTADAATGRSEEAGLWMESFIGRRPSKHSKGNWWMKFVHPDDQPLLLKQARDSIRKKDAIEQEFRLRHASGEYRYILLRNVPVLNADGSLREWVGTLADINDRRQVQEQLRQSEERLRLALVGGGMGIWEWDIVNNRNTWNEQEYVLYGLSPGTEIQHELVDSLIHPEDFQTLKAALKELYQTGGECSNEFRIVRPDGEVHWLAERATVVRNQSDQAVRMLGINYDITAHKQNEAELKRFATQLEQLVEQRTQQLEAKNLELERSNRELDKFAYVASHDLKSPLRAIENLADWISTDAAAHLPPSSQEHLEKMQGRVKRMEKLLDDLLAYSRVGRYRYNIEKIDLKTILHDTVELLAPPPTFQCTIEAAVAPYAGQRVPLETVLRNLIGNAIKHHNRSDGQIWVTATDRGEQIEFMIRDDGPGIDPKFHEKIFEMFQTLQPRDKVEGSGMGLAIVKKLIESLGGTITVASKEGEGATFRFTWVKGS